MDREEILQKSRQENADEGFQHAEDTGRKIGFLAFAVVFILIVLFNLFHGKDNYAPFAMFWAFTAAEAYPKYKFTQNKAYLITAVCGAIASLASLLSFVLSCLR